MTQSTDAIVIGGGIFGMTAALSLHQRGHSVALLDSGPIPHPLAASTDISKAVRMDYGPDEDYLLLGELAIVGWRRWNAEFPEALYHEVGVMFLTRQPMIPGGFEFESAALLEKHGHPFERLDSADVAGRFPAWNTEHYVDGYFNPTGGYAESGRVMAALADRAQESGVNLHSGQTVNEIIVENDRVTGVRTRSGEAYTGAYVIVAAGAWTSLVVPELTDIMKTVGQPVFHLTPANPALFASQLFPVFGADISHTGWYGFPLHPVENVVKVANHGPGLILHPDDEPRVVTGEDTISLRTFLRNTFPLLADAPITATRRCLYTDTFDGHLLIARHPQIAGLIVASGGSGHGFKFAPVLGDIIADTVEGKPHGFEKKFGWRTPSDDVAPQEAARYYGSE